MPFVDDRGVRLHYRDTGGGAPPLVLVHGFPLTGSVWRPQEEALSARARVIAPDLMGFGESDAPDDPAAYSVERFAENVLAVMDRAGAARAALGGMSMGGYVAFALLRLAPERITALILADTRAEADDDEGRERRTSQQERLRAEGAAPLADELLESLLGETTRAHRPDVVAAARRLMDNPAAGWIGALEAMKKRPDSSTDLPSVTVPTLVVTGEEDALIPPAVARSLHERIGGSRLVLIPEAGHFSNLEQPAHFSGALAEFLADVVA